MEWQNDRAKHIPVFQRANEETGHQLITMPNGMPPQGETDPSNQTGNRCQKSHYLSLAYII
jgi:hypothetical protein